MYFHASIDAKSDWLDTEFLPQIVTRYPVTWKGSYNMKGKLVEEFGVFGVEVSFCKKVGIKDRGQKNKWIVEEG